MAFRNNDTIVHHIAADDGSWDTGNIAPGATSPSMTMATVGTFPYHCTIHPTMVGTLNVTSATGY